MLSLQILVYVFLWITIVCLLGAIIGAVIHALRKHRSSTEKLIRRPIMSPAKTPAWVEEETKRNPELSRRLGLIPEPTSPPTPLHMAPPKPDIREVHEQKDGGSLPAVLGSLGLSLSSPIPVKYTVNAELRWKPRKREWFAKSARIQLFTSQQPSGSTPNPNREWPLIPGTEETHQEPVDENFLLPLTDIEKKEETK